MPVNLFTRPGGAAKPSPEKPSGPARASAFSGGASRPKSPFIDPDEERKFLEDAKKEEEERKSSYRPTLILKSGDKRTLLIRHSHPVWMGKMHSKFNPSTKSMHYFPCGIALHGECPLCDSGDWGKPTWIWEVVDVDGYTAQKGQRKGELITNIPRLYITGKDRYESLREMIDETMNGDSESSLVRVTVRGQKSTTVHEFRSLNQEPESETLEAEVLATKIGEFFPNPSLDELDEAVRIFSKIRD